MTEDQEFLEELKKDFLDEASFLLEQCEESYLKLEDPTQQTEELAKIFRLAHSMKGGGAAVGFQDLAGFAHVVEDCLSTLRTQPEHLNPQVISILLRAGDAFKVRIESLKRNDSQVWQIEDIKKEVQQITKRIQTGQASEGELSPINESPKAQEKVTAELASLTKSEVEKSSTPAPTSAPTAKQTANSSEQVGSIKIDTERVENVLNIVGELVVIKSQLMNQCTTYAQDLRLASIVSLMDRTIRDLQDKTLSMRMTPLKGLFLKMQRIVRDLSIKLEKPVDFRMSGEDTEIDRTMVELLTDPLMHIVRNSLDHGIESVSRRNAARKPEKGTIHLSAIQAGGRVIVSIKDDGAGLNRAKIIEKATQRGMLTSSKNPETLTAKELFGFICMPGFSTAEAVTDLSGRGVGMDVVKTNIERLKGTMDIESDDGVGTCLTISIPLTTSITDGMIIEVGDQLYILPMDNIKELVNVSEDTFVEIGQGKQVLNYRDQILPIVNLNTLLHAPRNGAQSLKTKMVAVVQVGHRSIAMCLDGVLGQTQVVLKPLSSSLESVKGVAGVAILGDGKVALALDPAGLFEYNNSVSSLKHLREIAA